MNWLELGQLLMAVFGLLTAIVKFAPTLNGGWLLQVIKVLGNITNRQTDDASIRSQQNMASSGGVSSSMKASIVFVFMALSLCGCGSISFPSLNAPKAPDTVYNYHQSINTEPRVVSTNAKGESVVFTAQQQTVDVGYTKVEKPLTWWQRICNWLAGLSIFGVLGIIAVFVLAPGVSIAWLKAEADKFKKAFTQTVKGIDASKVVEVNPNVATALSSAQDAQVKAMVDDIQQPGK